MLITPLGALAVGVLATTKTAVPHIKVKVTQMCDLFHKFPILFKRSFSSISSLTVDEYFFTSLWQRWTVILPSAPIVEVTALM